MSENQQDPPPGTGLMTRGRALLDPGLRGRRFAGVVVGVGLLAGVISAVHIGYVSMWFDESATISVAGRPLPDFWRVVDRVDAVHAAYYLGMHPWLGLFGTSAVSLRLPSVLAVAVAAGGVVVLGRQLADARVALAAGLVFAILPRVTWMGIEGRSFAVSAAAAVWLTVVLVGLVRRPRAWLTVAYAVLTAVGIALNIFLALLLVAHGVALLLDRRRRFRPVFWRWLTAGLVGSAVALPVVLASMAQSGQIGAAQFGPLGYLRAVLVNQWFLGGTPTIYFAATDTLVDGPGAQIWKAAAVAMAVVGWALVAVAVGSAPWRDRTDTVDAPRLLLAWLLVPTAALVVVSIAGSPMYNPRYLTFATPAVAILVGAGLVALARRLPGRRWAGPLAALLLVALAVPVYASQRTVTAKSGADWSLVADFVAAHRGPDQAVYFAPLPVARGEDGESRTYRTAQVLYPGPFRGLEDLTLVESPLATGTIEGRSRPLAAAAGRLDQVRSVIVLRRRDYPVATTAVEDALLTRSGLRPAAEFEGSLNRVVVFRRPG